MAVIPPRVRRGDTIGVCAPAGAVKPERFATGLERLGDAFRVRVTPSVSAPHAPGVPSYLAASDDIRLAELESLLADRDVRAVVLARGGYGIARILPRLDPELLRRDPKPIVGFSDATALLAWAHAAGVRGIHGPMIAQLGDLPDRDTARLIEILTEPSAPGARPWPLAVHGSGVHRGHLVAGNLTMMSVLIGTPWALPLGGAIALIEEVGERPYEIDRYFTHLSLAGVRLAGAVIGDFTRCFEPDCDPDEWRGVIRDRLAGVPHAFGAPIGHGTRNEAVPFGASCVLDLDAATLTILDPAVQ